MVRQFLSGDRLNNIEAMLIKQSKQICILYKMQKTSLKGISWLQTQVKKSNRDKNNKLSLKVFNVSNNLVCYHLISLVIYRYYYIGWI